MENIIDASGMGIHFEVGDKKTEQDKLLSCYEQDSCLDMKYSIARNFNIKKKSRGFDCGSEKNRAG